jgi:nicotinate-nucleotide adenylyltransferase
VRLGVFGGSFDPIHYGHLRTAEEARVQAGLDKVLFVPNHVSPFKLNRAVTPGAMRKQMVELAIASNPAFALDGRELDRPPPSYTLHTLQEIAGENPHTELFFLTGTDAVRDLPKWYEPEQVLALARFLAVARPGVNRAEVLEALPDFWEKRIDFVQVPHLDISSSFLRTRIGANQSVRYLLPPSVEKFIAEQGLYKG